MRSVINGAIFNRFAWNLDCTHDFKVSPPGKQKISIWGQFVPFWGADPFRGTKIQFLITFAAVVHFIWNLAGFSLVMISKRCWGPKFLILAPIGPMGKGQFWVPESAIGHKWSIFQWFGFTFGLYSLLLGSYTRKTKKCHMGHIWTPFGVLTLFGAQKFWGLITMEIAL